MKKTFFFFCLIYSCILQSQTVFVFDKTNLKPLENVEAIHAKTKLVIAVSNDDGKLELYDCENTDTILLMRPDYASKKIPCFELESGTNIYLSEKSYELNEVVVSATRSEYAASDIAQNISIINKNAIEFQNNATTADLLQQSGEVMVQKSQFGGGSPIMRGFEASRILLVVDGVRMNNAIYRAGHLQNIITIDQSLLERVELAFGPGSLMYGSDALGGVIHFTTINPKLSQNDSLRFDANVFARYSTVAFEKTGHVDFNMGWKKFASLSSITYSDFNDCKVGSVSNVDGKYGGFNYRPFYQDFINGQDTILMNEDSTLQVETGYAQIDILQKFLFQQNKNIIHKFNFQYSTSSNIPRYDRLTDPGDEPGTLNQGDWYYGPQNRLFAAYDFNFQTQKKLFQDLRLVASYQDIQESRFTRGFGSDNRTNRIEDVSVIGFNLDLGKELKKHQINYGFEMYLNQVNSFAERENIETNAITPASTRYPDGGSSMNSFGFYVSHIFKFASDKWTLNDGIRLNASMLTAVFIDTTFYPFPFTEINQNSNAITGSLGLVFMPDDSWRFALIGSTGFRTPNIDDLTKVFDSEPGSIVVPNPDLKPEYTYNADLNISKVIVNRIQIQATGFYTRFNRILTIQQSLFNGEDSILFDGILSEVKTTVNANKAYLYGCSLSLNADITDYLSTTTAFTSSYGRIETDSTPYPLDHIPPFYGRTGINIQLNKLKAEFYILYNGWKHIEDYNIVGGEDNEQYATIDGMPSWYTLNIKAAYQITDLFQIQAGCENLLDLNYRVFASGIGAPGRNVLVTLRGRF